MLFWRSNEYWQLFSLITNPNPFILSSISLFWERILAHFSQLVCNPLKDHLWRHNKKQNWPSKNNKSYKNHWNQNLYFYLNPLSFCTTTFHYWIIRILRILVLNIVCRLILVLYWHTMGCPFLSVCNIHSLFQHFQLFENTKIFEWVWVWFSLQQQMNETTFVFSNNFNNLFHSSINQLIFEHFWNSKLLAILLSYDILQFKWISKFHSFWTEWFSFRRS